MSTTTPPEAGSAPEPAPTSVSTSAPATKAWRGSLRTAFRYRTTRIGLALTLLVLLIAIFGPLVAPHSATEFVGAPFAGPNRTALLGTDSLGRDVLSQLLDGGRTLLWMAFASTLIGVVLGALLGLIAGYSGGALDETIMRCMDVLYAFPYLVLALLFVSVFGPKTWLIVAIVAIGWMPGVARTTRGITADVAGREYVEAAEVLGVPRRRILVGQVLPNLSTPLLVELALRLTWSVGAIAALSFLGFGVQPPRTDWGLMINENRNGLDVNRWSVLGPVLCIAVFAIGTNLLAEGVSRVVAGVDRKASDS
jgi:peptide/nickel transport system permease protein